MIAAAATDGTLSSLVAGLGRGGPSSATMGSSFKLDVGAPKTAPTKPGTGMYLWYNLFLQLVSGHCLVGVNLQRVVVPFVVLVPPAEYVFLTMSHQARYL